jgi:hypothetical protein
MLYFKTRSFILHSVLEVEDFPNIKELTWNYTKTGHGKGAPDGVGELIKRRTDTLVAQGNDNENFEKLIDCLVNWFVCHVVY